MFTGYANTVGVMRYPVYIDMLDWNDVSTKNLNDLICNLMAVKITSVDFNRLIKYRPEYKLYLDKYAGAP